MDIQPFEQIMPDKIPDNLQILEVSIPVDIQMDFIQRFTTFSKQRKEQAAGSVDVDQIIFSFEEDSDPEIIKNQIVKLALSGEIKAFRFLEIQKQISNAYTDYCIFAHQICRIMVEQELGEPTPGFISSGLGGKDNRLRYYIAIFPKNIAQEFSTFEHKIVATESDAVVKSVDGIIEKTIQEHDFTAFQLLLPIKAELTEVIQLIIEQSNEYGDFIFHGYLATNSEIPTENEVLEAITDIRTNTKNEPYE